MKEGWDYRKLGDVCAVLNGFAFKSGKYADSGTRVIRITNVQKGFIVDDDPKYYPSKEMQGLNQYILKENDLLMSLTGNVGRVGLLQKELLPAALNQRVACLRIKDSSLSLRFLFHWLNSTVFEQDAIFSASGIAQKNLSTEWLKSYKIGIPPLSEQQHIIEELDLLSSIIEKKKAQLKELDNLAQSLCYEMFGDPISNEKGWEVKKLGKLCITSSGGTPSKTHKEYYEGGNIPWLRSGEVAQGYIYNTEMYITEEGLNNSSAKYFPINTVVVAMYGATVGQVGILKSRMTTNQAICGIFPSESFVPTFLMFFLKGMKPVYLKDAAGGAQPNISQGVIKNTLVPIVSIALQQQFVERIEAIELQKELIKQSIKEFETLFNSRMDYYFN